MMILSWLFFFHRKMRPMKEKRSARIALRRNGRMSLTRPAAGGESCFAGFFLIVWETSFSYDNKRATRMRTRRVAQSSEHCTVSSGVPHSSEQSVTHLSRAPSTPEAPDTTLLSITSGSVYGRCRVSVTARFREYSLQSARCSTARQRAARYTPRAAPMAEAWTAHW